MENKWNIDDMEVVIVEEPKSPLVKKAEAAIQVISDELERRQNEIEKLRLMNYVNFVGGVAFGSVSLLAISMFKHSKRGR